MKQNQKLLIIGANGLVGSRIFEVFKAQNPGTAGTTYHRDGLEDGFEFFDIREPDLSKQDFFSRNYSAVVIAAAVADVGKCEKDTDNSRLVNVDGPLEIARQLAGTNCKLVYFSSDYVFDGRKGAYPDDAARNPQTVYGQQKAEVEEKLPEIMENHLIFRLSKTYSHVKGDGSLLDGLAKMLADGKEVKVATDQIFSPAWLDNLVDGLGLMLDRNATGLYNFCGPKIISRYDLTVRIAAAMGINPEKVKKASLHDFPGLENRPLNTSLVSEKLKKEFDFSFISIDESVRVTAENWKNPT